MPWSNPATRSTGYLVTATNWNELANDLSFLAQVAYVEFTANVTLSATAVGSANQIVSAGAITYEAVPHYIEFGCGRITAAAGATNLILRDGTTVLGTLAQLAASSTNHPVHRAVQLTPTAASHTYNVAGWVASGSGTVLAGTGGAAGDQTTYLPGFIRVSRVPT
jgi:hypothetical protein